MGNPIFQLKIAELKQQVEDDIHDLELETPEYDTNGRRRNIYKAFEYAKKLREFLELEYFNGGIYRCVGDIVGNIKFWAKDSEERIERNKNKIEEIKKVKKLKGQISLFDKYSLSDEDMKRAIDEPDLFLKELKEENIQLEKDKKLARFVLAYLMHRNQILTAIYE
ncbi:MAG: hypothetical protein IKI57_06360 [Clostridia bacterium]|nr:hypothetical protein [Clostridia bacterium]